MTTKTRTYWENDNGAIACEEHVGAYMTAEIAANPKAKTHRTPIGTFYRMTAADVADFEALMAQYGDRPECCETCRR